MSKALIRIRSSIFDPTIKDPKELKLLDIKPIIIYYCFYGRNAWHSTWVQKYSSNSMHITLRSAKQYAENERVQGSVFYIEELPALYFDGGDYPVVVTQINSLCPLKEYSSKALRENMATSFEEVTEYRKNCLAFGTRLDRVIQSFKYYSPFWKVQPPPENSVILLYSKQMFQPQELTTTELKAWKSKSRGSNYYLSWLSYSRRRVQQSSVLELYNQSDLTPKKLEANTYLSRGKIYHNRSRYNEAFNDYTQAIALSQSVEAYVNRGQIYHELAFYDKAINDYTQAIEFSPSKVIAYINRSKSYKELGYYNELINDLARVSHLITSKLRLEYIIKEEGLKVFSPLVLQIEKDISTLPPRVRKAAFNVIESLLTEIRELTMIGPKSSAIS